MDGGEEGIGALGVSGSDCSPLFEVQDGIFYQMPQFVEVLVIGPLLFSVAAWRNLRLHPLCDGLLYDGVTVVSFVRDQVLSLQPLDQFASARTIRHGTRCNKDSDRHTMRIHGQMQLGVEPPFVRPIAWLPPAAPVACG